MEALDSLTEFLVTVPLPWRPQFLLTGGTAALLYGSDRPFSKDYDLMIPLDLVPLVETHWNLVFERYASKPVFHSLKAALSWNHQSYDLIAESVVQPESHTNSYAFQINDALIKNKELFSHQGVEFSVVPREFLVLLKLLAARGPALNKYDLYDVDCILTNATAFRVDFFQELLRTFIRTPHGINLLREHAVGLSSHASTRLLPALTLEV